MTEKKLLIGTVIHKSTPSVQRRSLEPSSRDCLNSVYLVVRQQKRNKNLDTFADPVLFLNRTLR